MVFHIAQKILACISESLFLGGHEVYPSCSIGISCYPDDANNTNDLIKYAESAMYQAKKQGRNSIHFYTENINQSALQKLEIETALRQAIADQTLEVYYQPQVETKDKQLSGAEALLRWDDAKLGSVSPVDFISIAEESGLIVSLGEWVFREVCKQVKTWADTRLFSVDFNRVAINISPVQLNHPNFIGMIESILETTQVPVEYLEIELTESVFQETADTVVDTLMAIKSLGIQIAIDDFGTGYSSLSRLKQFPIDLLKIDRSFIQDISSNASDKAIVKAILAMANALNLSVLAEGIETQEQLDVISSLQCQYYQGYFYSKPIDAFVFECLARGGSLGLARVS